MIKLKILIKKLLHISLNQKEMLYYIEHSGVIDRAVKASMKERSKQLRRIK